MQIRQFFLLAVCTLCIPVWAQNNTRPPMGSSPQDVAGPDLLSTQDEFFDPTRKKQAAPYQFTMQYRIEAGYVQNWQRSQDSSFVDMYLHGGRIGFSFDFMLPYHFTIQTGIYYTLLYGQNTQSWGMMSYEDSYAHGYTIDHRVWEHDITIPVRAYYIIPLYKKLNLFFYTGPQLHIGVAQYDDLVNHLTDATNAWMDGAQIKIISETTHIAVPAFNEPYDRYIEKELWRANIQWGLGGGLEWDRYRLVSGYDFGLNNLVRAQVGNARKMNEWGWFVSFSYRF